MDTVTNTMNLSATILSAYNLSTWNNQTIMLSVKVKLKLNSFLTNSKKLEMHLVSVEFTTYSAATTSHHVLKLGEGELGQ